MFFESTRWPNEMHIARALIEGPLDREPSAHVFYESHVEWLNVNDSLPKKVSQSSQSQATSSGSQTAGAGAQSSDA